jgi:hypothetical protein
MEGLRLSVAIKTACSHVTCLAYFLPLITNQLGHCRLRPRFSTVNGTCAP